MNVPDPGGLRRGLALCLAGGLAAVSLSGCASIGTQPWQRDQLAKQAMQLNPHPTVLAFKEHIYFSKEGSSGGRTFDGGGCGCN